MNSLSSELSLLWGLILAENLEVGLTASEPANLHAQGHSSSIIGGTWGSHCKVQTVPEVIMMFAQNYLWKAMHWHPAQLVL